MARTYEINHFQPQSGRVVKENKHYLNFADEYQSLKNDILDQAGRWRTSQPIPLGDYKCINDRQPFFFDTVTNGTASVVYNNVLAAHDMTTATDGDYAIVQTYQRHNYFAGKSHMIEITTQDFDDEPNVIKRLGYYSSSTVAPYTADLDGIFLESDGVTHRLKVINNGFEVINLPQSEWSDPLDGTGESGFTIDWETFNVFSFNFLWLGGTGLRFYITVGSRFILVHEYTHVGSSASNRLIIRRPNQPIRYEIRQNGAGSGEFQPICATVVTEGSDSTVDVGSIRSVDTGATNLINVGAGAVYVVKGIRLRAGYISSIIDVIDLDMFVSTTNDNFKFSLHINPTPSASLTWTDVTNTAVQETTGDGVLTLTALGSVIASGYSSSRGGFFKEIQSARKIGVSIAGVRDELILAIEPLQGSTNLQTFGAIIFKEFI